MRLKSGSVPYLRSNIEMLLASLGCFLIWKKVGMTIRLISLPYCEDFVVHVTESEMYLLPDLNAQ